MLDDETFSLPGSDDESDDEAVRMSLEQDQEVIHRAEEQQLYLEKGISGAEEAAMPEEGVLIHKVYKTVHRSTDECQACCGIKANGVNYYYTTDFDDLSGGKLCWRAGCAPWHQAPTEPACSVDSSSDSESETARVPTTPVAAAAVASPAATPSL
jgi:hypothetical protein